MRKQLHFILLAIILLAGKINFGQTNNIMPGTPISPGQIQNRGCATPVPPQQWEAQLQQLITQYLQQNPQQAKGMSNNSTMSGYSIPVIMHVIHGGQAVGTFPNLLQGQLNSQVTVLDNDYGGVGQNTGNYPATAFTNYATNAVVLASSKDASGRIAIANFNINFCLATKDTLGNILPEPGIDRVNYNNLPALTGTFTSKDPSATAYNTSSTFMGFIDGYIKKNTIWNITKYLNIWVTDQPTGLGLLGYATFPALTSLTGIPSTGTPTTDGFWSWASSFGSSTIFPGGTYYVPYDKGRTCTHEIGHWLGLRHVWGDGTCLTDYCNDTPPATTSNFGTPTYPYQPNTCTSATPPNGPNGCMFMNFMDYTDDLAMYMFTNDQRTRAHVAMSSSPYRNQLGTHGLCNLPAPIANFTVAPNPVCVGSVLNIGDLSLNVPSSWSYTMTGGTPSTASAQNPTVSYATAGVYSITLIATNAAGSSTPHVQTVTVTAGPAFAITTNPSSATVCAGSNVTITPSGATSYTLVNTGSTTIPFIATPTVATIYSITATTTGTNTCRRTQTVQVSTNPSPTLTVNNATICPAGTATLTVSGANTYSWSTGATTTVITVSPASNTVYTVTGTSTSGCKSTKTVSVTIGTGISLNIVASPTAVCSGASSTLTASGATSYTWSTGSNSVSIVVTPSATTNYTVNGTSGTCSGTKTISLLVNANPTVTATASSPTICVGGGTNLNAGGATSYTWNPGNFVGTTYSVTPGTTTTYTVTGANASGCTSTKTVVVNVNSLPTINVSANPTAVCAGNSSTLTATGATTYSWSGGGTGSTKTVTPTGTSVYTVTGTTGLCSGSNTISVTVNPTPTVTVNNATICPAGTATLIANGATTYSWSTSATTSVITVSPSSNTTYTVTGNSLGCTNTKTVSVTIGTAISINISGNPTTVCAGNSSTLTATGATTYTWSTGPNTASVVVAPTTATTYTVNGKSGSCTGSATISIAVNQPPTAASAGPSQTVCSTSATLSGNTPIVGSGAWTLLIGTGTITNVTSPTSGVTGLGIGINIFKWTTTNGVCSPSSSTVAITVNSTPTVTAISSSSIICSGSPVNLTAGGASTYSWSTGATTSVIVVSPTVTTTYTVNGNNGPCSSSTTINQLVSTCTGINQNVGVNYNVIIYPNPFKEELNINAGENVSAEVYNTLGQLIIIKAINVVGTINTSELAKGVYYIHVSGASGSKTLKIVKE